MHKSPSPAGRAIQTPTNTAVTETGELSDKSGNQELVSGLFSKSEIDADLKLIIERWDGLSVELRQAIVKMVR